MQEGTGQCKCITHLALLEQPAASQMVGRVALSLSVGLRWRSVRLDSFQTRRWRWATMHSELYLSNWDMTTFRQSTNTSDEI